MSVLNIVSLQEFVGLVRLISVAVYVLLPRILQRT